MIKRSKRYKQAAELIDQSKQYSVDEAIALIKQFPSGKFDASVGVSILLGIDAKKSDQLVRGTIILPHGTGKSKCVVVFCQGEAERQAKEAGADFVGGQELIEKVAGGWLDFDCAVATPDMMKELSKLGRVLGPRGLMPSPKTGGVTKEVSKAVKELKAGKIEFKSDKQSGVHVVIGRVSFEAQQLKQNFVTFFDALQASRPVSVKGDFIKSVALSSTMSPGVRVTV